MMEDHTFADKLEGGWVASTSAMVWRLACCSLALSILPTPLILSTVSVVYVVLGGRELTNQGEHFDGKSFTR